MKTKNFLTVLTFILFTGMFWASSGPREVTRIHNSQVSYENTERNTDPIPYNVSYTLPVFKLVGMTSQNQTIGGITVLCELNSFSATRLITEQKEISTADPEKPGYDIFKITKVPYYEITPDQVRFTIKIINNLDFPIELNKVPIILKMDGIGISLAGEAMTRWNNTIAAGGETTIFEVPGPTKGQLDNAQNVILQIQNVPTTYDKINGALKNFESFKWYFEIKKETITKADIKEVSYQEEPVYKESCSRCNGTGRVDVQEQCSKCLGTKQLKYTNYKTGESWIGNCDKCNGTGYTIAKTNCSGCKGKGFIEYPKSPQPEIKSNVVWSGWEVNLVTIPAGAGVSSVDPKDGNYKYLGTTNGSINWFSTNTSTDKVFPIVIEYGGTKYKVTPYDEKGNPSPEIRIDFRVSGSPKIKGGKFVQN